MTDAGVEAGIGPCGRPTVRVRTLGGLDIDGIDPHALGTRKARTLLKVLALARGVAVPVDRLAEALWGDTQPARPAEQVGILVSRLRRVLGAERLVRLDAGYALRADWLDLSELDARAEQARSRLAAGGFAAARAAAQAALELVRGPLLGDDDAPWAEAERAAVNRAVAGLRMVAAEAALAAGDAIEAAGAGEAMLEHDPYDEVALRLLMTAHATAGRPASALAAYARVRERLAEDLGVSPAPETEALHRQILLGEIPASATPRPPGETVGPRLAGRAADLAALMRKLDQVTGEGRAGAVVVEGEAGIGKTALARAFAAQATAAGAAVLWGRCDELGRDLPLQPILDGLAAHLRAAGPEAAAAALGPQAALVGPLLGGGDTGVAPPAPTSNATPAGETARPAATTFLADAGAAQALLFAGLLAVVERLGERVAVIVDDLHLAGPSTVEWLRLAARRGRNVLVVATHRPEERAALPEAEHVVLGPLDVDAAEALVGRERAVALHARSGGNPLLLLALAAATGEQLPETVRQAVTARAAALGAAAATIRTAAVLGPAVDLDLLVAVLGVPASTVLDHLEAAAADGLLEEHEATFAFAHDLVREALEASTTASRRAFLHREAARILAARLRTDVLAVARHARLGGDVDMAAAALVAAADAAATRFDLVEAERLLDDALGLAEARPARLARARVRLARLDYAGAWADVEQALALGATPDGLELAGWVAYYRREFPLAERYAEEAVQRAESPAVRASCLALSGRLRHSRGRLADADARLSEALATAPPDVRGVAHVWLAALRLHQGRPAEAVELTHLGLLDVERTGHPFARFHALYARVLGLGLTGRAAAALAAVSAFDEAISRHGGERFRPLAANLRGWILRSCGEESTADEWNEQAVADAVGEAFAEPRVHGLLDLADGRLLAGDLDGAAAGLARAEAAVVDDSTMAWHQRERLAMLRARLALAAGDAAAALALAHALAGEAGRRGSRRYELFALALAARVELLSGGSVDFDGVDAVLRELDGLAGFEAWRITAELAAASGQDRWWIDAERRASAFVAAVGPGAAGERAAAWIDRRLAGLRSSPVS